MKKFITGINVNGEFHSINPDHIAKIWSHKEPEEQFYRHFILVDIGGQITSYEISAETENDLVNMER